MTSARVHRAGAKHGPRPALFSRADPLRPWVDAAHAAELRRREATPLIKRARNEWDSTYAAAKRMVEALLRSAGRPELKKQMFRDLAEARPAKAAG